MSPADLPDEPTWVETRAMLLRGSCRVFPPAARATGYVVVDTRRPLASVVDRPQPDVLAEAVRTLPVSTEVLVQEKDAAFVTAALRSWTAERAILHTLREHTRGRDTACNLAVSLRPAVELASDASLGAALRAELRMLDASDPVAVGEVSSTAVSFCYAGAITERYWDVSVETLEEYRGRGFAGACAQRLIDHYRSEGKAPVWGAVESNHASRRAAQKLGFVPAGSLFVFRLER